MDDDVLTTGTIAQIMKQQMKSIQCSNNSCITFCLCMAKNHINDISSTLTPDASLVQIAGSDPTNCPKHPLYYVLCEPVCSRQLRIKPTMHGLYAAAHLMFCTSKAVPSLMVFQHWPSSRLNFNSVVGSSACSRHRLTHALEHKCCAQLLICHSTS